MAMLESDVAYVVYWFSHFYEATQMNNFTPLSSANENNLGLAIRNELIPVFRLSVTP